MSGFGHSDYLQRGGTMSGVLQSKYESGELNPNYEHQEFPKMLNLPLGIREFQRATEVIRGKDTVTREWTEYREMTCDMMVKDADEEELVLRAVARAAELEIELHPDWTSERLRVEIDMAERIAAGTARPRPSNWLGDPATRAKADLQAMQTQLAEQAAELSALRAGAAGPSGEADAAGAGGAALNPRPPAAQAALRRRPPAPLPVVAPDPID